jgi:hypothetical protein
VADLDTAAADLVVQLQGLEAQITRAQHELAELEEQLSTVASHVDADWASLEERVQALLAKVHEEKGKVDEEGQAAVQSLTEVSTTAHTAQGEAHPAMQQASSDVSGFSDHVASIEPQVESMVETVSSAAHALAERAQAAETNLEEALTEAREFLQDQVLSDLHHMQEEIKERSEHLRSVITEEETRLDQAYADWTEKLTEVEGLVEQAFADAHDHARDVVNYSVEECSHGEQGEAERLATLLSTLEGLLEHLHSEAEECTTDIGEEGKNALDQGLSTTKAEITSALAALARVKELLAKFSFVSM